MTVKPEPTAVGSSTTASPQRAGDTRTMSTKPTGLGTKGDGRWGDTIFQSIAMAAGATIIGAIALMASS